MTVQQQHCTRGGRLLSQGAYGCVYKPGLRCPNNALRGSSAAVGRGFVSKLQRAGRAASTEVAIGARIRQTMPRYAQRFAPVVESCAVHSAQLPKGTAKGCRAVADEEEEEQNENAGGAPPPLVIMRMPSAGEQTLGKYLNHRGRTLAQIGEAWHATRDALQQMADDAGVVHFDFKGDNAMWSRARRAPVVIDFGLALYVPALLGDTPPLTPVEKTNEADTDAALWRQGFFALHPAYSAWCPEAVLCAALWQSEIRGPQSDGSESTESPSKEDAAGGGGGGGGGVPSGGSRSWRSTDVLGAPELAHMRTALAACFERHPTLQILEASGETGRLAARRAILEEWVAGQAGRTRLAAGRDLLKRTWRKWDRFALAGAVLGVLHRRGESASTPLWQALANDALE